MQKILALFGSISVASANCSLTPISGFNIPNQEYSSSSTPVTIIHTPTTMLFNGQANCQVASCTLVNPNAALSIGSSPLFAVKALENDVLGQTFSVQVACTTTLGDTFTSYPVTYTQNSCNLVKKANDPAKITLKYSETDGTQVVVSDTPSLFYDNTGCEAITSCALVNSPAHFSISSTAPYAISVDTAVVGGYTQTIQVSCKQLINSAVLSGPLVFEEDCALVSEKNPKAIKHNYNGQSSTVIIANPLERLFFGSHCVTDTSIFQCALIYSTAGITIDTVYPFAVSAPTNNLEGAFFGNVQVECKLGTDTYVESVSTTFEQTCVPEPLPNVSIASQNFDIEDSSDVIVPNVLFHFFDGTSRCVSYINWKKCEFVGSNAQHLSIVETYPFEITADLRVLGGYKEDFQVACTSNTGTDAANDVVYTSSVVSFEQTCIPSAIVPSVQVPSLNYDSSEPDAIFVLDTPKMFFAASECVNWSACTFTGQDPLSIGDVYPFSLSADLTRLGGYTREFTVSCTDNYRNPTTYTSSAIEFKETCIPKPVTYVIPDQDYSPSNKASVIVADTLTSMYEATECVNWSHCEFQGVHEYISISQLYPFAISADISVQGGFTTSFTVVCTDLESFPKTYTSSATFTQTCVPEPISPAVVIPDQNYDPVNTQAILVADTLAGFFTSTGCFSSAEWLNCDFVGGVPANLVMASTYPFAITAHVNVLGGYTDQFTVECTDKNSDVYTSLQSSFTQDCTPTAIEPSVPIHSMDYDPTVKSIVIVENPLTKFYTGTGCVADASWASCGFYGTQPSHLTISSTFPFAISADLSKVGGYEEQFIVTCTDGVGTYQSEPTVFEVECITAPILKPVFVMPKHYDPVTTNKVIVERPLTEFFTGTDCVADEAWTTCIFISPIPKHLQVQFEYPFTITATVDYAPGYKEAFRLKCITVEDDEYTSTETDFTSLPDPLKPREDFVYSLPEMDDDFQFGVYSGYVNLPNTTKEIYYMLTESQNDWRTDPLLIWLNGGPGCSSMLGWATENGPYLMVDGETSFEENPYAWNRNASVLYFDNPAGVGFSYCDSAANATQCKFDDNNVGTDMIAFLEGWYQKFTEYKNHDLYISGESYAGIYVPMLALNIEWFNGNNTDKPGDLKKDIPLKGWIIGNGCTNWDYDCMPATLNTTYGRAIINDAIFDNLTASECYTQGFEFGIDQTPECTDLLNQAADAWNDIDLYNLYLPSWGYESSSMCTLEENEQTLKEGNLQSIPRRPFKSYEFTGSYRPIERAMKGFRAEKEKTEFKTSCVGGSPLATYLNGNAVREALHIPAKIQPWQDCSDIDYTELPRGTQFVYEELKGKIRMLKYSGDKDGVVPTWGTLGWINALKRTEVAAWRAWEDSENQVAGYFWQLDGLDFGTVHGAGHMVPMDQSERAFQLIFNWIQNKPIDPKWKTTDL